MCVNVKHHLSNSKSECPRSCLALSSLQPVHACKALCIRDFRNTYRTITYAVKRASKAAQYRMPTKTSRPIRSIQRWSARIRVRGDALWKAFVHLGALSGGRNRIPLLRLFDDQSPKIKPSGWAATPKRSLPTVVFTTGVPT